MVSDDNHKPTHAESELKRLASREPLQRKWNPETLAAWQALQGGTSGVICPVTPILDPYTGRIIGWPK